VISVAPASVDRIRKQGSNSGGFEREIAWELLDHETHHPGIDTFGFHRGGLATERERVLATWVYVSPASIFARRFEAAWPRGSAGFGEAAELAVR
jgi:hypothetical protein